MVPFAVQTRQRNFINEVCQWLFTGLTRELIVGSKQGLEAHQDHRFDPQVMQEVAAYRQIQSVLIGYCREWPGRGSCGFQMLHLHDHYYFY